MLVASKTPKTAGIFSSLRTTPRWLESLPSSKTTPFTNLVSSESSWAGEIVFAIRTTSSFNSGSSISSALECSRVWINSFSRDCISDLSVFRSFSFLKKLSRFSNRTVLAAMLAEQPLLISSSISSLLSEDVIKPAVAPIRSLTESFAGFTIWSSFCEKRDDFLLKRSISVSTS